MIACRSTSSLPDMTMNESIPRCGAALCTAAGTVHVVTREESVYREQYLCSSHSEPLRVRLTSIPTTPSVRRRSDSSIVRCVVEAVTTSYMSSSSVVHLKVFDEERFFSLSCGILEASALG